MRCSRDTQLRHVCGEAGPLFISHSITLTVKPIYAKTKDEHEALLPESGLQAIKDPLKPIKLRDSVYWREGTGKGQDRLQRRGTVRASLAGTQTWEGWRENKAAEISGMWLGA